MKSLMIAAVAATLLTTTSHALERTVALPYDYSRSITANVARVPNCTPSQYVGVSSSQFVCKDFPTCAAKEVMEVVSGTLACQTFAPTISLGQDVVTIRHEGHGWQWSDCPSGYVMTGAFVTMSDTWGMHCRKLELK